MLIGASLLIMSIIVIFSLILGGGFTSGISEIAIDNLAIVDGGSSTFVIPAETIFYNVSIGSLQGAILVLTITLIGMAALTGISVLGSGINPQSTKVIILAAIYGVLWYLLSVAAFGLISSIEIYGAVIYIFISIAYVIGAIQKISGGE